jgi:hypothetical protein
MKIYFRDLEGHLEAIYAGRVYTFESGLVGYCEKRFGPASPETWHTFRPPRTKHWVSPEGIEFVKEEFATAFLLVYRKSI